MIGATDKSAANSQVIEARGELSEEERAAVRKRAIRSASEIGLIGALCWYVFWVFVPNTIPGWAGLTVFAFIATLGYWFARLMLRRQVKAILTRRKNLLLSAERFRTNLAPPT